MKKILLPFLLIKMLFGVAVTEYLYEPIDFVFNDNRIVTNNTESDKEFTDMVFIHDLTPSVIINNFVNRNTQHMIPFNNWNAGDYTGLNNATEQWGFTGVNDPSVIPSSTAVQSKNEKVGMLLNTTSQNLVTSNTGTSIQYSVGWVGDEGIGANLWNTRPNDDLCSFAEVEINSSFSTDNNDDDITTANQTLITYIFRVHNSNKSFFYNITLHESRGYVGFGEFLMPVDGQDTIMPIVITFTPSNSPENNHHGQNDSNYSKPIESFGLPLQAFSAGDIPVGSKYYGSCVGRQEMENIIADIKSSRSDFDIPAFTIENIRLDTVIMGPEINTNTTITYDNNGNVINPGFKEEGLLGMTLHGLTVYRLGGTSTTVETSPSPPTSLTGTNITTSAALLSWSDNSNNETAFKLYQNNQLIATLPANTTSYAIYALNDDTAYTFEVRASNEYGESESTSVTFHTLLAKPSRPVDINISSVTSDSAVLSWEDTSDNEIGFKIYRDDVLIATLPANTTTYTLTNLQANTSYTYTIVSYNTQGESLKPSISFTTKDNYAWLIPIYHMILN